MSQWDERLTVVENIQLPHTLLSRYVTYILITLYSLNRFDLIFLMLDPQDEQFDRRLGTHLVSLYHQTQDQEDTLHMVIRRVDPIPPSLYGHLGHDNPARLYCICKDIHTSFII